MERKSGKIGIFDSGLGGLTILREIIGLMPDCEYLYLGDNLRVPYGDKSQDEIFRYTLAGTEWLFDNGAEIVILACNTASAAALRRIQQEVLPFRYQGKRVLGIIIPTVEDIGRLTSSGHVGVLATNATIDSGTFESETNKYGPQIRMTCQSGGRLADMVESGDDGCVLSAEIEKVVSGLISKDALIDTVILGCTHYALIGREIGDSLPKSMNVVSQGRIVAEKLADYLDRHGDIRKKLSNRFSACFHTTSSDDRVKKKMAQFYGEDILVSTVTYGIRY